MKIDFIFAAHTRARDQSLAVRRRPEAPRLHCALFPCAPSADVIRRQSVFGGSRGRNTKVRLLPLHKTHLLKRAAAITLQARRTARAHRENTQDRAAHLAEPDLL